MKTSGKILLTAVLLCGVCAGVFTRFTDGGARADGTAEAVTVNIENTVPGRVKGIAVEWIEDGVVTGKGSMEIDDGTCAEVGAFGSFGIDPDSKDEPIAVKFTVTEIDGGTLDICTVELPEAAGSYDFELRCEDGCYSLFAKGAEAGWTADTSSNEGLLGAWHIAEPGKDFADRFACYAEFGASMTLGPDREIRWNIGAEGGRGTFTLAGGALKADIVRDMDGAEQQSVFAIERENGEICLTTELNGARVCWVRGAGTDIPAAGLDEQE